MRLLHLRCCHATRKFLKIFVTGQVVTNLLDQASAIPRNIAQTLANVRCSVFGTGSASGLSVLAQVASVSLIMEGFTILVYRSTTAVISGSGRTAVIHPEFFALCGHHCMEPIACTARDPESKGMVENTVRYVKHNALQGRDEELQNWNYYGYLAIQWRDAVANVRLHERFHQRPVDRYEVEKPSLRPLPALEFNTDELILTEVRPIARIEFDGNRYSVPPKLARKTVLLRANATQLRIFYQGEQVAAHARSFGRRELIIDPQHQLEAIQMRRKVSASEIEKSFGALGNLCSAQTQGTG